MAQTRFPISLHIISGSASAGKQCCNLLAPIIRSNAIHTSFSPAVEMHAEGRQFQCNKLHTNPNVAAHLGQYWARRAHPCTMRWAITSATSIPSSCCCCCCCGGGRLQGLLSSTPAGTAPWGGTRGPFVCEGAKPADGGCCGCEGCCTAGAIAKGPKTLGSVKREASSGPG